MVKQKNLRESFNGWVFLDKPKGISSNKALQRVRKLFLGCKAGYVGTLDPLASGFLPIALGKTTKFIKFLENAHKEYTCLVTWGIKTSTGDQEGNILEEKNIYPDKETIKSYLKLFIGKIKQIPPKYSAIKINGERAYNLARNGKHFNINPRDVDIFEFKLKNFQNKKKSEFYAKVGTGTYIRTLIQDLAKAMGTLAHLSSLRRVGVGNLDKKLISLDSLEHMMHIDKLVNVLKPTDEIFKGVKTFSLNENEARLINNGMKILKNDKKKSCNTFAIAKYKEQLVVAGFINNGYFWPNTIMNVNFKSRE